MATPCPYVIEAPLGRGGQATTFRARHPETGAVVALKRFRLAQADTWKAHELFERECQVLAALDHPAVPRFIACGHVADGGGDTSDGDMWLAMELVDGEPLSESVKHGRPRDSAHVEDLALQALGVLEHLHALTPPVIHRDIKPANVVLRPDGWIVLVDFGSVRTALRPDGGSTVVGTFGYLAPEQLHGEAGPTADLYSLGMTLAALATGVDAVSLPRRGLALDVERILPEGRLRDLVAALTKPDPADRPASAKAARALLVPAPKPAQHPVVPEPLFTPVAARPTRRGPLLRLLVAFATLFGGFVLDVYDRWVLPRRHRRRMKRAERRAKGDAIKLALAVERLEARSAYEHLQVEHARKSLDYFGGRIPKLAAPATPRTLPHRRG